MILSLHKPETTVRESNVYLMVLAGFERAISTVETVLGSKIGGSCAVLSARLLTEEDRAFSHASPIWRDDAEADRAMTWAKELGQELLATDPARDEGGGPLYKPVEDALGWRDCQALIAFPHNIPSDTLPIFWSRGLRGGKPWVPLCERSD
jgi:hypothetical protein